MSVKLEGGRIFTRFSSKCSITMIEYRKGKLQPGGWVPDVYLTCQGTPRYLQIPIRQKIFYM